MTKEKAIKCLERMLEHMEYPEDIKSVRLAIEALSKCETIDKIIDSYDADVIANYIRRLFS